MHINGRQILVLAGILTAMLFAWYWLSGSSATPASLPAEETTSERAADQDLVSTLLSLRTAKLDHALFSDPAFTALVDFSTSIMPEPVGRVDPFAPLGATSSAASTVKLFTPAAPAKTTPATQSTPPASKPPATQQSTPPATQESTTPQDPPLCNQHQTFDACVACAQRRGFPSEQYTPYCQDLQPLQQ